MKELTTIPAFLMRGGTSKGAYIFASHLPSDPIKRDAAILALYGSPDARQISGIGGADPLTSKVAIVSKSEREDADVDYTFGYVGVNDPVVDYEGNCGNMSSGVGPFAIYKGLVPVSEPETVVRIFNTNTKKIIEAHVPCANGTVQTKGDYAIDGVPGTGAKISLHFLSPGGSKTGKLLPTGNVQDTITLQDGRTIQVSLVDAANPAIFVRADALGYTGKELPKDTQADPTILETLEDIRTTGAVLMGLATSKETASPAVPKVCMVSPPQDYTTTDGRTIKADHIDLVARTKALAVMHKAYAVTGGICTATAALIDGTVVNEVVGEKAKETNMVRLAHPSGQLDFEVVMEYKDKWILEKAGVARTAKPILDGVAYLPAELFE